MFFSCHKYLGDVVSCPQPNKSAATCSPSLVERGENRKNESDKMCVLRSGRSVIVARNYCYRQKKQDLGNYHKLTWTFNCLSRYCETRHFNTYGKHTTFQYLGFFFVFSVSHSLQTLLSFLVFILLAIAAGCTHSLSWGNTGAWGLGTIVSFCQSLLPFSSPAPSFLCFFYPPTGCFMGYSTCSGMDYPRATVTFGGCYQLCHAVPETPLPCSFLFLSF